MWFGNSCAPQHKTISACFFFFVCVCFFLNFSVFRWIRHRVWLRSQWQLVGSLAICVSHSVWYSYERRADCYNSWHSDASHNGTLAGEKSMGASHRTMRPVRATAAILVARRGARTLSPREPRVRSFWTISVNLSTSADGCNPAVRALLFLVRILKLLVTFGDILVGRPPPPWKDFQMNVWKFANGNAEVSLMDLFYGQTDWAWPCAGTMRCKSGCRFELVYQL